MKVIFIHGPAAAGKFTIAKRLNEITGLPLFHNHLTVDLVLTLHEFGTDGFINLREEIWIAAFKSAANAQQSFIFTFHPEKNVAPSLIEKLQSIVEDCGGHVHYIQPKCAEAVTLERLDQPSRTQFGKLQDRALYQSLSANGSFDFPPLPAELEIDTETTNPEVAAKTIKNKLQLPNRVAT